MGLENRIMDKLEKISIEDLIPYARNSRTHSDEQVAQIAASIKEFGFTNPVLIDNDNGIIAGHGRVLAGRKLKLKEIPCLRLGHLTDSQKKAYVIADNKLALNSGWDAEMLKLELVELKDDGFNIDLIGFDGDELAEIFAEENSLDEEISEKEKHEKLIDKFIVPPFTILDTRQGYWIDRKKIWRELIGDNGESREGTLAKDSIMSEMNNGVSLLDPVLAEIAVRWFGIENGSSFDCFAGDSVFGYVSSYLGQKFIGIELREEQAKLNNERIGDYLESKYFCDDGRNVLNYIKKESQDLLFSCPPYFDLEVYSNLENDASNQDTYEDFLLILEEAFTKSIQCLKNNRFAVIVVGDIRDKKGFYYSFPDDIKRIFIKNDCFLYNDMILVESLGTLPQRVQKSMNNRKVGKCHQNVIVFYKGDPKKIQDNYKKIEVLYNEE